MLRILNCGAGVQSTTLLLMAKHGLIPPIDHAVFADTGWEPQQVYDNLPRLEQLCQSMGTGWHVVTIGRNIREDSLVAQLNSQGRQPGERWASMPLFIKNPDGSRGMIRRQCTYEYKIRPIHKQVRLLCGLKPRQRAGKEPRVEQIIGISYDERQRMRDAQDPWVLFTYPLVEMKKTRLWCQDYLEEHGWSAVRSACIGCPFHTDEEWRRIKLEQPEEFEEACQVDDAIRRSPDRRGAAYLHSQLIPLREVDLRNDYDKGQLPLFEECSGTCFT